MDMRTFKAAIDHRESTEMIVGTSQVVWELASIIGVQETLQAR